MAHHYLEKCQDFEHDGRKVLAGRLGYRINARFVHSFFWPHVQSSQTLFTDEMLRPELRTGRFSPMGDNIVARKSG